MFYQIFLLPKVKRGAIVVNKHGIYKLLHQLPKNLRLRILGNLETWETRKGRENLKTKELQPTAQSPPPPKKKKGLLILAKNSWKMFLHFAISHEDCSWSQIPCEGLFLWKQFFASNSPLNPFKPDFIPNFCNSKAFHSFNLKFKQPSFEKTLIIVLLTNCFYDLLTEVKMWYWKTFNFVLGRFLETKLLPKYDLKIHT